MTITKECKDNAVTLKLEGWLDTTTAPELGAEVDALDKTGAIVLDFDKLEYISSAGLRQIVAALRKARSMDAAFSIVNVGGEIMNIFKMTGLHQKMTVVEKA